jgi:hypothetical protein
MVEEMIRALALSILLACGVLSAAEAERYRFVPKDPTWLTANIDLRDPSGALWPSLVGGRNAGGELRLDLDGLSGAFTVRCDQHSQIDGDQSRRVLGEAARGKPVIELAISAVRGVAAPANAAAELARATGEAADRPEPPARAVLVGTLAMLGRKEPVEVPVTVTRSRERLILAGTLLLTGARLGLALPEVRVELSVTGYRHPDDLKPGAAGPSLDLELAP